MSTARKAPPASWYTPAADAQSGNPTKFKLRELNGIEMQDIVWFRNRRGALDLDADATKAALLGGLQDWQEFRDAAGEIVPFNPADRMANLQYLDRDLCAELALEIVVRSTLTEEQRKNLLSQRTSVTTETNSTAPDAPGEGTATKVIERP